MSTFWASIAISRRTRDMVEVDTQLITAIHAERLLGQTHELVKRLVRGENEHQHAIHIRDRFRCVAGLDHPDCGLLIIFRHLPIPMHALVVAQNWVFRAVDSLAHLHQDVLKHLLRGEELPSARVHILLPSADKHLHLFRRSPLKFGHIPFRNARRRWLAGCGLLGAVVVFQQVGHPRGKLWANTAIKHLVLWVGLSPNTDRKFRSYCDV